MSNVTDTPAAVVGYDAFVTVRWSDMDAFQHINHARMVTLLEEARIDWLLSEGSAGTINARTAAGEPRGILDQSP